MASTEHLDELRPRLAEQTDEGSTIDRVTIDRLARMRHRLSDLEHISENTVDEAVAISAEEEVLEIMDSLENVRELRPSDEHSAEPVGAKNSVTSRDLHVLVYQATEAVSSQWPDGRLEGGRVWPAGGCWSSDR